MGKEGYNPAFEEELMYLVTREKVEAGTRLAFDTEWEPGQTKDPLAHSIGVDLVLHANGVTGSHKNRVRLQDEYECFFIIADLHTLTTRPEKTAELEDNIRQMVLDYLSC